jgi:5-methylcytosine-specific restriction endonuclease McrA
LTINDYKTCSKCQQLLLTTCFNKFSRGKDGLSAWCKECNKKYQKAHQAKNAETYKAKAKIYRQDNKAKLKEANRKYYELNKESRLARNAEWRLVNADRKKLSDKNWQKNNPEKRKQIAATWFRNHPDKASLNRQIRRARLKNAKFFEVTSKDIAKIMAGNCIYCGAYSEHVDHVIPLSRGGQHSVGNLVPSCQKCNLSKNNKTIMEWRVWKLRVKSRE